MAQIVVHALHATMEHGRRAQKPERGTVLIVRLRCVFAGLDESKR
jgi:hypothetical protein